MKGTFFKVLETVTERDYNNNNNNNELLVEETTERTVKRSRNHDKNRFKVNPEEESVHFVAPGIHCHLIKSFRAS